jgi:hypothetical protein
VKAGWGEGCRTVSLMDHKRKACRVVETEGDSQNAYGIRV